MPAMLSAYSATHSLAATVLPTVVGVFCYKQQGAAASGAFYAYATVGQTLRFKI